MSKPRAEVVAVRRERYAVGHVKHFQGVIMMVWKAGEAGRALDSSLLSCRSGAMQEPGCLRTELIVA
jgi:hypothetical protein